MRTIMADEFICDTGEVRRFIGAVKEIVSGTASVEARLAAIRPLFSRMMADPDWLPAEFRRTPEAGGMGKGIANWLLYRDTEGTLSLCAEAATPVGPDDRITKLTLVTRKHLSVGSFYDLIPPKGDIHRVVTTSDEPSISLHLLGNDVGCVWRHRFEPETGEVAPFRSGYSNKECENDNRNPGS